MNRLGLFTGSGVVGAAVVPLLVVLSAFATGGDIFSAGPLNADQGPAPIGGAWSHADLTCGDCHTPFWSADLMGDRCLDCHTNISGQLATPTSLHAGIASPQTCRQCHPDHRGSHTSLTLYAPNLYPHAEFGFYLISHLSHADGRPFTCSDCHVDTAQAFTQDTCIGCHQDLDTTWMATHELDFGFDCLACHDGIDTYGERFEHQATAFPLEGLHVDLACSTCHGGAGDLEDLRATPTDCVACHAADDTHQGSLGTDCAGCHTPAGWGTAKLDHSLTAFPLVGGHLDVACETCHVGGQLSGIPTACVDCHRADDPHAGNFGTDCGACHTPDDWLTIIDGDFDHRLTGFSLTGAHASVATCAGCHRGGRFAGTPTTCVGCHAADDAHDEAFGTNCSACHTTSAWTPADFDHAGLTDCASCHSNVKPANHPSGQCSQCHTTNAWKPATFNHAGLTDCASCHSNDKPANHFAGQCSQCHGTTAWLPATLNHTGLTDCTSCHVSDRPANHPSGQCSQCHSTNAWKPATFDHTGLTDCTSCHTNVKPANHYAGQCSQCHSTTAWLPAAFNHSGLTDCASCHTNVKPANHPSGQCSQCHSTTAWLPATLNHNNTAFPLTGRHTSATCTQCHTNGVYDGTPTSCSACHASDDAHSGQFGTNCASCHTTSGWSGATFNHNNTSFPLTGRHTSATCTQCHTNGVYDGTPTSCSACHNAPSSHPGFYGSGCTDCHNTNDWSVRYSGHSFPLNHRGAGSRCTTCHTDSFNDYTCYNCHDPSETQQHHEDISDLSNCAACHPDGRKD